MHEAFSLLKQTYAESQQDKVPRLAASLAYFTIFSLAPLLMVVIAIAGAVFGREAAAGQMVEQMRGLIGAEGGKVVEDLLRNAGKPKTGAFAAAIGVVTLIIGASGAFVALQDALNTVWGVMPKPGQGIRAIVKDRALSFAMVVCIGFLLLVSLVVSAALSGFDEWLNQMFPAADVVLGLFHQAFSFAITTLLFALMFKYLPDVKIEWRDVWIGAVVTALLFTVGKWLIGLYLGNSSVASVYGAAGSLVVILIWVFYSAQIFLLGAEFTQVYTRERRPNVAPRDNALPVTRETRERQGIPCENDRPKAVHDTPGMAT